MSIVISVVEKNRRFYIAWDLRAIRDGVVRDDYEKVFELKQRVYFGMTGIAEAGLALLEQLRAFANLPVAELIDTADEMFHPNATTLTVMLAGQDEEDRFFIWQKNNAGCIVRADAKESNVAYSIAGRETVRQFDGYFRRMVISGASIEQAIAAMIRFASTIDSTISPTYRMIKLEGTR